MPAGGSGTTRPEKITPRRCAAKIRQVPRRRLRTAIFVAYADCGTGGLPGQALLRAKKGVERIPGAHCYEFLCRRQPLFAALSG